MPYGSKLYIPLTNLLLAAKHEPYKKAYLCKENTEQFSGKSSEEWTSRQEKITQSNRTRQKNQSGESKVESNDSPKIPDREDTSDIQSLPSRGIQRDKHTGHSHCSVHNKVTSCPLSKHQVKV